MEGKICGRPQRIGVKDEKEGGIIEDRNPASLCMSVMCCVVCTNMSSTQPFEDEQR